MSHWFWTSGKIRSILITLSIAQSMTKTDPENMYVTCFLGTDWFYMSQESTWSWLKVTVLPEMFGSLFRYTQQVQKKCSKGLKNGSINSSFYCILNWKFKQRYFIYQGFKHMVFRCLKMISQTPKTKTQTKGFQHSTIFLWITFYKGFSN